MEPPLGVVMISASGGGDQAVLPAPPFLPPAFLFAGIAGALFSEDDKVFLSVALPEGLEPSKWAEGGEKKNC